MRNVYIINPPDMKDFERHITKDMAGGFGFNAGQGVILPPLELIYHALTLKKEGYSIYFYDLQAEPENTGQCMKEISTSENINVIMLATALTLKSDLWFIRKLKKTNNHVRIWVKLDFKSQEITSKIMTSGLVEAMLTGETEDIIGKILEDSSRDGTTYLLNGKIIQAPQAIIENLDDLPDLEIDFLKIKKYRYPLLPEDKGNFFTFQSSRGCPFPCAYYCPYPLIQGTKWRAMPAEKLFRNIDLLVNKYKVNSILFRDATFTLDKKRIIDFCEKIHSNNLNFSWWCETRMNCLDEELLKAMAEAGCQGINLGVETGDDELMRKQGKIGGNVDQLIKISNLARKFGVKLHFLMIVGLPDETKKSLYESYRIIEKLRPESLGVTTITPYPGTDLYRDAVKNNWIVDRNLDNYIGNQVVMKSKYLSPRQIRYGNFLLRLAGYLNRKKFIGHNLVKKTFKIYFFLWSKT